jgi:hypothetical protein
MSARLARLWAIVRADFFIRLRRPSTVIVFLILSGMAYLWVPDPATGRALMQVNGRRVLYNSAATGMATAMLATLFIGLAGYYVVSNAVRRDILSRCGFVIASTTMRGGEYILGKFAGNVFFLSIFSAGFMVTAMGMQVLRGEAPLQPFLFAWQYLLVLPPVITFVSALSILFECTPVLRTKFGDVLYFFIWVSTIGVVASLVDKPNAPIWPRYVDVTGFGYVLAQMRDSLHTNSVSIGSSDFNAKLGTITIDGLHLMPDWILPRLVTLLAPLLLLVVARFFFHRFDPARVRAGVAATKGTWLGRFNAMAKPFARLALAPVRVLIGILPRTSLAAAAANDAVASIATFPLAIIGIAVFAIMSLGDANSLFSGTIPIALAAVAMVISDVSSREKRAGTTALIYASPKLRTRFILWKYASTVLLASLFLLIPFLRAWALRPTSALPLLIGILFTCAAATALGTISTNPKTFIVSFLLFWYIVMNDKATTPSLDFAGFHNIATPAVTAAYAAGAVVLLVAAQVHHTRELRMRW